MAEKRVGSVVLVDGGEKPVGIYTESDILKKVFASNRVAGDNAIKDVMSSPVVIAGDYIETAAAMMAENRVKRRVLVEQDGSLAGLLSATDIARSW